MVLVDTSVWVDHFREKDESLHELLLESQVVVHPWVVGELACGNLANRREVLDLLRKMQPSPTASDDEAHLLIEKKSLMGMGIGWVDVHLLASSAIGSHPLWTRDRRLLAAARQLNLSWT